MEVQKRDKSIEPFQFEKIENAIGRAFASCGEKMSQDVINCIRSTYDESSDEVVHVEDIQDSVERCLMATHPDVAKHYIIYRYNHKLVRENKEKLMKGLSKKLMAQEVENQNANVDERSFGGRVGEASRLVTKQYALDYCMSRKSRRNHVNNEIYIHDLDSYAVGNHNCLTMPLDDLLAKGFNVRQCDVRPAKSINTAFQLVAVLFQIQSLQQFGGVSASHIDWTMVPYVRRSLYKHYILEFVKTQGDFEKLGLDTMSIDELDEWIDKCKDNYLGQFNLTVDDFYVGSDKLNKDLYQRALLETRLELNQAVEGMYHNLNTLQSRSGNQLPFSSLNYGTCTLPEGRMVTRAILEGSIKGVGKHRRTPIFPCGIFQSMKGVNRVEGDPNYDLFRLALKSTSQRLYPNYVNVDWSGNKGYDINDPRTYMSTMGCHAIDTPIIMSDGSQKMVQDIVVGDTVMGGDGTPRTVLSLIRGNDQLFRVDQSRGESYVVNEGHILALEYSVNRRYKNFKKGDKVNMSVHDYMNLPEYIRRHFKGYKGSYDLPEKDFDIPPYILGLWLGDGNSNSTRFSVNMNETQILKDLEEYAKTINKNAVVKRDKDENCYTVDITNAENRNEGNIFRQSLIKYNLIKNKHIPECYYYGSKEQRKALLAGLINTDGWARNGRGRRTVCFGNTNFDLIKGAKRIADSLGYTTNIIYARGETIGTGICEGSVLKPYYHLSIHEFDDIHLMENKRTDVSSQPRRNFNTSTLKITKVEKGDFYGFELDGDKLYLFNDCTVTHNCRTVNGFDINGLGQLKDGRGNIAPVTIIMPTLAMQAKKKVANIMDENSEEYKTALIEEFFKILSKKIGEARDMLIERFEWICSQSPESAKFMWENNTMAGYIPEEGIRSALRHGTLVIGNIALAETLQILIGKNHTTDEGMEIAKRIYALFNKKTKAYKEKYKLNFGVYNTPAENLVYTAMQKFKAEYGIIKNVSDRKYFTNSMHVPVWEEMTPFEKIDIESQLTGYSNAGCITYVELPSTTKHNIDALEKITLYSMEKDIPYLAFNIPVDDCDDCGYSDEMGEACPVCGGTHIRRLRRVTGYLTGDYKTAFNLGKQDEVEDRVKHVKEF